METKQVIVVRKDLTMRKGKIAAQVAHASMKAVLNQANREVITHPLSGPIGVNLIIRLDSGSALYDWLDGIFTKIVVGCDSEQELLDLYQKAKEQSIINALIKDAGKTEFNGVPTFTALAIGPDYNQIIDKITSHLKLL